MLPAVTLSLLRQIAPNAPSTAAELCPYIDEFAARYGIDTRRRLAMFLAQSAHESGQFRWLRELWGPTDAQRRYEGRADLGNTRPGDGFRYRGRGLFQYTGRANYTTLSKALGIDYVGQPDLLSTPRHAVLSACYYWSSRGLSSPSDQDNLKRVTLLINGGLNGLADRQQLYSRAKRVLQA